MPNVPKTPHRTMRVEDSLWETFDSAVKHQGEPDRSAVLRAFMAWYVRLPGAKLPQRPGLGWPHRGHGPTETGGSDQGRAGMPASA